MRRFFFLLLLLFPGSGSAQIAGTRFTLDVTVNSVVMRGDTAQVTYILYNRPQSQDSVFMFVVDAPARVRYISRPQPSSLWLVDSLIHVSEPAAFWSMLSYLAPSASTPSLQFESVGLPGVVTNWAIGKWPIKTCCDDDPPGSGENVLVTRSVQSKTVGVEPWPGDRSSQAMLSRLRTLTQNSCSTPLNWITDSSLCTQLIADIDAAESFRASGSGSQVQTTIDHYNGLLGTSAAFAPGVTSPAFWLLSSNAGIIRAMF